MSISRDEDRTKLLIECENESAYKCPDGSVSFVVYLDEREPATIKKPMSTQTTTAEYLVICRGVRWDESLSPEDIQIAMKRYYAWFERMSDEGKIRSGHQLAPEGKVLSGRKGVTDGPFAESKEGIAGYWFIQAASLEEALEIAKGDPLLDYGHTTEIRPILEAAELQDDCETFI